MKKTNCNGLLALVLGGFTLVGTFAGQAVESKIVRSTAVNAAGADKDSGGGGGGGEKKKSIVIKRIEAIGDDSAAKERTWLGVGLSEPDEVLVSQLGLKDGAGLVVTYVADDSPAAKAGVLKNDVLLELEGQSLMVPAQLQKLVQARKAGDKVAIKLLRGGKRETVTATLAATKAAPMASDGGNPFSWSTAGPGASVFGGGSGNSHGDHIAIFKQALDGANIDQKKIQVEVRRSMDEARKAMEEALRTTNKMKNFSQTQKEIEALAKAGVFVPNDASVVVRSTGKSVRSMVKSDDTGTISLVGDPKLRLTARDQDGKVLFDGEVETKEQREKVPADLWKKVEPMIEKLGADGKE